MFSPSTSALSLSAEDLIGPAAESCCGNTRTTLILLNITGTLLGRQPNRALLPPVSVNSLACTNTRERAGSLVRSLLCAPFNH